MKRLLTLLVLLAISVAAHAEPLRVFIRGGKKSHGPNAHEHEKFLNDWKVLLAARGMKTDGAMDWPTAEQFAQTDVLVMYAQEGGNATPEQKTNLDTFIKRGGGLVVIHTAAVSNDPPWWKSVIGGAWVPGKTKWKEGPMDLYYTENQQIGGGHPITRGASNFHIDDEVYYDMDIASDVRVLATTYTPNARGGKPGGGKAQVFDIQPQMWTYERTAEGGTSPYRAVVSIPGHLYFTFEKPHYRAILLRSISWAAKHEKLDEFVKPEEIAALTYPEGGPQKPADTLKALEIHPDFTMKLVAAEPLLTKPMNFDWDAAGRLWVAETPEYPNGRRGMRPDYRGKEWKDHGGVDPAVGTQDRKGLDKISILTDSDGDGVMDKKVVFYEGLELVTGLVFHKDGVIVTQAPDILFLRDTDGDGKCDKVEKLYTGLGTMDTHAVINNPRLGWDGWIYATHGYSKGDVTSGDGSKKFGRMGDGVVRFKPDGSAFEQYSSKGSNTWGLTITGDNRQFYTQPTCGEILMQTILPEYALARGKVGNTPSFNVVERSVKTFPAMTWEQMAYVQIDQVGAFTAAAGCAIYDGGTWPAAYNGGYFTTEPTINIVHHAVLTPKGSSYTASKQPGREETEFIRSKDMWWRPIEARVGPDGALYIGDFYNQAVIHNDTRGPDHNKVNAAVRPDRDHYFGRIWRVDHKDAKKIAVPDLSKAGVAELVKALEHPSAHVRMTANRLIAELAQKSAPSIAFSEAVGKEIQANWSRFSPEGQIAALWAEVRSGSGNQEFQSALQSKEPALRRNAALICELAASEHPKLVGTTLNKALIPLLNDSDAQVRLAALRALAAAEVDDAAAKQVVASWPKHDDDFQRSAAVGAALQNPAASIAAALDSADPAPLAPLVAQLADSIGRKNDTDAAARLVVALAAKPASADALKGAMLDKLNRSLKAAPEMTPELSAALAKLLVSGANASVLPLAAKWDKAGALKGEVAKLSGSLLAAVADTKADDATRLAAARSLIGLRGSDVAILPAVVKQLAAAGTPGFQRGLIAALGETDDASVGAALSTAYAKMPADVQAPAFDTLLKRADWTLAFLDALKANAVDVTTLGPTAAARLRTHPDKGVAKRATEMLTELNPLAKAKKEAIAKLLPVVEGKGDPAKGKALFTQTCATCHKFGEIGADIGPALTGMGAHGAGELLGAIVDPNAEVDPTYNAWNLETKDGQLFAGVIASENAASITLKSLAGVQEVKVADLKSRVNTGRSLMPEGFEGLGGETLRDIIAFMQSVDGGKFRVLDLKGAFTTNTGRGLYNSAAARSESFEFAKTGTVLVEGIPFSVVAPEKAAGGSNIVVLKGGPGGSVAQTMPQRVEVKVSGFKANRLHFLGGVTGWGFMNNDERGDVLKITVHAVGGASETFVCKNGTEFADYINRIDVPGSKFAGGLVKEHQLRWFTKPLSGALEIDRIVLESFGTGAVPTIVAITAELADAPAKASQANAGRDSILLAAAVTATTPPIAVSAAAEPAKPAAVDEDPNFKPQFSDAVPQPPAARPAKGPRVLIVGGGSSHDFVKFFGGTDKATLEPVAGWVDFTQNLNGIPAILDRVDVLLISANQPIGSVTKKALIDYANRGGAIIAHHPGTWYAWRNFPDWNKEIIGGGTRGHDALGPYKVKIANAEHPITKGVTAEFEITDELYNYNPDPAATPTEVLATATSPKSGKVFPQVFIVKHPKARIVGLTLGHDARAHDLPEYQTLLKNAVIWAGGK
ncbi:MAG: ThuA domain-containing protein [Chthoniobacter sp.]|nr:ThuA domain-containing protein [Chthoniobacter sp.]